MKVVIASQSWGHTETSMYTHSRDVLEAARTAGVDISPLPLKSYRGDKFGGLLHPLFQRTFTSYPRNDGELVHHIDQDTLRGVDVVTIHDLACFHGVNFDNKFADLFFRSAIRASVRRARRVIVTTHASMADLSKLFPESSGKVTVVPVPHKDVLTYRLPTKYDGIWVGRNAPNKRVMDYLDLARRNPDRKFALRCSASPGRGAWDERMEVALATLKNVTRITGPLSDDELERLYRSTKVYVATSSLEGFHRPPIEHYLRGGTIVVPAIQPYTEIYPSDAVHWYEPENDRTGSMSTAFEEALEDTRHEPDSRVVHTVSFKNVGTKLRGVYEDAGGR